MVRRRGMARRRVGASVFQKGTRETVIVSEEQDPLVHLLVNASSAKKAPVEQWSFPVLGAGKGFIDDPGAAIIQDKK
jgi:hypothetical protein